MYVYMFITILCVVLRISTVYAQSISIGDATPSLIPLSASNNLVLRVNILPTTTITASLTFTAPSSNGSPTGTQTTLTGTRINNRPGYLYVTLPSVTNIGTGLIQLQNMNSNQYSPLALRYYSVPVWTTVDAPNVTSAGLTRMTLHRDTNGPLLPSSSIRVLVSCSSVNDGGPTGTHTLLSGVSDTITILDRLTTNRVFYYVTTATVANDGNSISITTQAVPAGTSCGYGDIYVTMNEGSYYHYTGLSITIPIFKKINVVSLYPYKITLSPWIFAQNQARISMSSSYTSSVDIQTYYEESWRLPALPTGTLIDPVYFDRAIKVHNATFIICAGTQYNATAVAITAQYPKVNVLLLSTLRQVLPARANLAFASGRMYEAMFYAGFVAASVSPTGRLGFIAALVHSGSYNFVNAFLLGARYAHSNGFTSIPVSTPPNVTLWTIGAFSDDWAERNAAADLLTNHKVDILLPVTDNISPQLACHMAGCYSLGFNADERTELGDNVLISVIFNLAPIYAEFVRRMITGAAFGPDSYMGGLGAGVEITSMSAKVPLAAQQEVTRLAALSRLDDTLEEVFCNTLIDSNGNVRLNGNSGATYTNVASVIGDSGKYCLSNTDINSMRWVLQGVTDKGKYNPPPKPVGPAPSAWEMSATLVVGIMVLPIIIFIIAILSSVLVIVYRKTDVIRYSSPLFLFIINIGACLFGAVLIKDAFYHPLTTTSCVANLWGSGLAFALLFGSLFAKTYRVHRLFNNKKLKRLRLNVYFVLRIIGIILIGEISILLAIHFLFPRESVFLSVSSISTGFRTDSVPSSTNTGITYYACTGTRGVDGFTVLYAIHLILLVWGAYLAYRTRDVPFAFNEAAFMGAAIYNVVVCEILAIVLSAVSTGTQSGPFMQHVVSIIRMGIPPLITLLLLYVPKAYVVYKGLQDQAMIDKINHAAMGSKEVSPNNIAGKKSGSLRINSPSNNSAVVGGSSGSKDSSSTPKFMIDEKGYIHGFDLRSWWAGRHGKKLSTDATSNVPNSNQHLPEQSKQNSSGPTEDTSTSDNTGYNGSLVSSNNQKKPKIASNKVVPTPQGGNNPIPQFIISPPIPVNYGSGKNLENNNNNRITTIHVPSNSLPVTDIMSPEELENFMAGGSSHPGGGTNNDVVVTATEDAEEWTTIEPNNKTKNAVPSHIDNNHNRLVGQQTIEKGIIGRGNPGTIVTAVTSNIQLTDNTIQSHSNDEVSVNVSPSAGNSKKDEDGNIEIDNDEEDDDDEEEEEDGNGDSVSNTLGKIGKTIFRTFTNPPGAFIKQSSTAPGNVSNNRRTVHRQDTGIAFPPVVVNNNVSGSASGGSTTGHLSRTSSQPDAAIGVIPTIHEHVGENNINDDGSSVSLLTGNPGTGGSFVLTNPQGSNSQTDSVVATSSVSNNTH